MLSITTKTDLSPTSAVMFVEIFISLGKIDKGKVWMVLQPVYGVWCYSSSHSKTIHAKSTPRYIMQASKGQI